MNMYVYRYICTHLHMYMHTYVHAYLKTHMVSSMQVLCGRVGMKLTFSWSSACIGSLNHGSNIL